MGFASIRINMDYKLARYLLENHRIPVKGHKRIVNFNSDLVFLMLDYLKNDTVCIPSRVNDNLLPICEIIQRLENSWTMERSHLIKLSGGFRAHFVKQWL